MLKCQKHEAAEATHITTRIISSNALALLELQTRSASLHLFAYQKDDHAQDEELAFFVGRHQLPGLAEDRVYLRGRLDCSPVSLSGLARDNDYHHLLVDGEGILTITVETFYAPIDGQSIYGLAPNVGAWTSSTTCALIKPSHAFARARLGRITSSGGPALTELHSNVPVQGVKLSWLLQHLVRPTQESICGYRLYISGDSNTDWHEQGISRLDQQTLRIYDFTPMRVKKAGYPEREVSAPIRHSVYQSIFRLENDDKPVAANDLPHSQMGCGKRFVETATPPWDLSSFLYDTLRESTRLPYILTTQRLRMSPYHVCQVVYGHMLLCQVSGSKGADSRIFVEYFAYRVPYQPC
jgi:hypothetical protein